MMALVCAPLLGCGSSKNQTGVGGTTGLAGTTGAAGIPGTGGMGGNAGGAGTTGAAGTNVDAGGEDAPIVQAFATQALAIANEYLAWGRVDDELRWAPFLCRQPLPGIARESDSHDATTHGQKLYSVFAKHHDQYPNGPHTDQAVVKQSWKAELVTDDAGFKPGSLPYVPDAGDHFYPYAQGDGGVYRASAPAGLFIMFRLDPTTPDTDGGWVYATISTAGQVTSAGRVASCMGCHEVATHERLFGVPLSPGSP
jgi:hypothetical protein